MTRYKVKFSRKGGGLRQQAFGDESWTEETDIYVCDDGDSEWQLSEMMRRIEQKERDSEEEDD